MANTLIQIKRTSVSGRAANSTTLSNPGELALNMTDGIMYSTNGSTVFEIGANTTTSHVTNSISIGNSTVNSTANSTTINTTLFTGNVSAGYVNATSANIGSAVINSIGIYTSGIINANALQIDGVFTANSTEVYSTGNFVAAGNVSASYFIGDGTYLTGLVPTFQEYVFANSSAGINGYDRAIIATSFTSGTLGSFSNTVSTTNTFIGGFITDTGYPNETIIPAGTFTCYIETQKSAGGQDYFVYYEVYKRTTGGTETLLVTSDTSSITSLNTLVQQQIPALLTSQKTLASTDRLVFKFYGAVVSGGTNPTITLYFDNTSQSYIVAPTQTADSSRFVPYTQATANLDMNGYSINAAAFTVDGNFSANTTQVVFAIPVQANGSFGTPGQVLTTNGATGSPYWSTVTGGGSVNTDAAYVWTNVQTFNANLTVNGALLSVGNSTVNVSINSTTFSGTANNSTYAFGKTEGNLNVNSASAALTANNSAYLNNKTEANLNVNSALIANNSTYAFGKTEGNLNVNSATSALNANNSTYVNGKTEGNLNVNSASTALNANNTTYVNGKTEGNLNVNSATSALNANNASYLNTKTEANLNVNSALIANNSNYLNSKAEADLNVNTALVANNSTYAFGKSEGNLNVNNSVYLNSKTESNLNVNSALTANNSAYLGGTAAASYVQNTDSRTLSGNLTLTGANLSITGTNTYITSNVVISGSVSANISGVLTGNVSASVVNASANVFTNTVFATNVNATNISGNLTGNVSAITVGATANVTTNTVFATNIYATTVNAVTIQGSSFSVNNALINAQAINIVNQVNTATLYATTSANIASAVYANSTGLYAPTVNAGTLTVGTTFSANSTKVLIGNTTTNAVIGYDTTNQTMAEFAGNANGYTFVLYRNANSGTQASADIALYNDSWVGAQDKWVDLGISSSTWANSTWTVGGPNDAYLYTGDSNLVIGANGQNYVGFFTGGTLAANERMRITYQGNVGISNTNPDAKLAVTGTANISGAVTLGSTLYVVTSANIASAVYANSSGLFTSTLTGNVTGILTGNVSATVVNASANVFTNTVFATNVNATNISGNLTGNVSAITVGATANVTTNTVFATNVNATTVTSNTTGIHTGNVSATVVNASANVFTNTVFATNVNATVVTANVTAINVSVSSNLYLTSVANLVFASGAKLIDSTGSQGTVNQILASNGSGNVYWSTPTVGTGTGAGTDTSFFISGQTVNTDYTTSATKNYMSAGPITLNANVVITVGSRWVVV